MSPPPQNLILLAMFTYNFLNIDILLYTPIIKHFQTKESKPPLFKNLLRDGTWQGSVELLTWGRGYACVCFPEWLLELQRWRWSHITEKASLAMTHLHPLDSLDPDFSKLYVISLKWNSS